MSNNYGPSIVTDGLTLYLDVSNTNSYPGSGNTWTDLAQSIPFSATGTTTPYEVKGGVPSLAFNGSGWWYSSAANGALVDLGGDCTIELLIYSEDLTTRRTVFEKAGTSYSSYQQEIAMTWEVNETITGYSRYSPTYDYSTSPVMTTNVWNHMAFKMTTGKTTAARTGGWSRNGATWNSTYVSRSNVAVVASGALRVGYGYAGVVGNGNIAMVRCYNKVLSQDELDQNFSATKDRFNL